MVKVIFHSIIIIFLNILLAEIKTSSISSNSKTTTTTSSRGHSPTRNLGGGAATGITYAAYYHGGLYHPPVNNCSLFTPHKGNSSSCFAFSDAHYSCCYVRIKTVEDHHETTDTHSTNSTDTSHSTDTSNSTSTDTSHSTETTDTSHSTETTDTSHSTETTAHLRYLSSSSSSSHGTTSTADLDIGYDTFKCIPMEESFYFASMYIFRYEISPGVYKPAEFVCDTSHGVPAVCSGPNPTNLSDCDFDGKKYNSCCFIRDDISLSTNCIVSSAKFQNVTDFTLFNTTVICDGFYLNRANLNFIILLILLLFIE